MEVDPKYYRHFVQRRGQVRTCYMCSACICTFKQFTWNIYYFINIQIHKLFFPLFLIAENAC